MPSCLPYASLDEGLLYHEYPHVHRCKQQDAKASLVNDATVFQPELLQCMGIVLPMSL